MIPAWLATKLAMRVAVGVGIVAILTGAFAKGCSVGRGQIQAKWDAETVKMQAGALAASIEKNRIETLMQGKIDEQSERLTQLEQDRALSGAAYDLESRRMRESTTTARRRLDAAIASTRQQVDAAARTALGECAAESERIQSELGSEVERVGRIAERNADTVIGLQEYVRAVAR